MFCFQLKVTSDNQFENALNLVDYIREKVVVKRGKPPDKWE